MKTTDILTDEQIIAKHDHGCRHRAKVELAIAHRVIHDLSAAGYTLEVNDGEEITKGTEQELISAIFSVDDAHLQTRKTGKLNTLEHRTSFVYFVLGNEGHDVISDYGMSLDPVMAPINDWIDQKVDNGDF